MKRFINITMVSTILIFSMLFSREVGEINVEVNPTIMNNGKEYSITQSENQTNPSSREEIILWEEDFENNAEGWSTGSGWQLTTDEYNSETHSMNSPNDASTSNGTFNLLSPTLSIAELGDGETMNFSFWIYVDQPDYSQTDDPNTSEDESNYLADYYIISLFDLSTVLPIYRVRTVSQPMRYTVGSGCAGVWRMRRHRTRSEFSSIAEAMTSARSCCLSTRPIVRNVRMVFPSNSRGSRN